jgi:hypothetical protein
LPLLEKSSGLAGKTAGGFPVQNGCRTAGTQLFTTAGSPEIIMQGMTKWLYEKQI